MLFSVRCSLLGGKREECGKKELKKGWPARTDGSVDVCALTWTVLAYIILLETGINISPWVHWGCAGGAMHGPSPFFSGSSLFVCFTAAGMDED